MEMCINRQNYLLYITEKHSLCANIHANIKFSNGKNKKSYNYKSITDKFLHVHHCLTNKPLQSI